MAGEDRRRWHSRSNGKGAFRRVLFQGREPEAVAVLEVGCQWRSKPEQAAANADYLRLMIRHSGLSTNVYTGILYWRDGDVSALETAMEEYGIDFAVHHLSLPGNTVRKFPRRTRQELQEEAKQLGVVPEDGNLTDRLAYRLIVEGNGEYASLRGGLAYHASMSVVEQAARQKPRGRLVTDVHIIPPGCVVNGERVFVRRECEGEQIDCILVYDKAEGLANFVDKISRKKRLTVRSRLDL